MIQRLHIDNFAIVSDLTVDLCAGLNILSGETGAGKSIIIGGLNLLLGDRAQTEMIRSGQDVAVVEGTFKGISRVKPILKKLGIEADSESIEIRREIRRNQGSRCFIEGQMVTLADLKAVGQELVDLVGQHHQQLLLDSGNHISFLDDFAGNRKLLEDYQDQYRNYQISKSELGELRSKVKRDHERVELYRFQFQEIEEARLSSEEEGSLLNEKGLVENAEKLKSTYHGLSEILYLGEGSTTETITDAVDKLKQLEKYDNDIAETIESLKGSLYSLQEAGRFLEGRAVQIEYDPQRLQEIEERLDVYYNLKKKYGGSLPELFEYRDKIGDYLANFSDSSNRLDELAEKVSADRVSLSNMAEKLSMRRHKAALRLAGSIEKVLAKLLMGKVEFAVKVSDDVNSSGEYQKNGKSLNLGPNGIDLVELLFSPNPGEELKSLARIASGGELSRVLLALKTVISGKKDKGTCLIFDEIDSGIGGKTASAIGRSLQSLSENHQVLVITHLQQIASCGKNHFLVTKEKHGGRMITQIRKLSYEERKREIGRMISGDMVTRLSIKQAEELLDGKDELG